MLKLFFKYLRGLKPYAPFLLLLFCGDLVVTSFGLITPLFSRLLFDYAYPLRELFILNVVIAASISIYFIQFFINVLCDYMSTYVDQSYVGLLTRKLFLQSQRLPLQFHNDRGTGDLINLFTHDVNVVVERSIQTIPQLILNAYSLVSILVIALFMNYKITLLALLSVPIYILETGFFSRKEEALEERDIELDSEFYDTLHERFKNIRTVKAFSQEEAETNTVAHKRSEMNVLAIKRGLVTIIAVFSNSVTIKMWTVFISWYMGYLVIHNELTVGEIVALLAYVGMMADPIQQLAKIYTELKVAMVSYRRIDEVLTAKTESEEDVLADRDIKVQHGQIRFDEVDFSYNANEKKIFDKLSFEIAPKTAIAIVGESGSGKSTIVSLLMRFYKPTGGLIYVDGQNLSEIRLTKLREQIGLVQQDFNLFQGTLRENILYGTPDKTEADLILACKRAQIYDFINGLEDGFEHEIGVDGEGLSGGQRQRIAIARVLLRDPQIIIFDEATSALDPESEFKITEVINSLIGKKNLFIIAHRLSTIKKVDTILMLDHGKIAECGTFHELLDKKGHFFRYYSRQFGGFEAFKKILEIEYERVGRYGSQFNLIAARAPLYTEYVETHGEEYAAQYVDELGFFIKKNLRKGDSAVLFYKDILLILLPEINREKLVNYFERMNAVLQDATIRIGTDVLPVELEYSAFHLEATPYKVVDDLIQHAVENLDKVSEDINFTIESVVRSESEKNV